MSELFLFEGFFFLNCMLYILFMFMYIDFLFSVIKFFDCIQENMVFDIKI